MKRSPAPSSRSSSSRGAKRRTPTNADGIDWLTSALRILRHRTTRRILRSLGDGASPRSVTDLAASCGCSTSAIRRGLATLAREGYVAAARRARRPARYETTSCAQVRSEDRFIDFHLMPADGSTGQLRVNYPVDSL